MTDHPTAPVQDDDAECVTISMEVYRFLLGEGQLDGVWFGDNPIPAVKSGAFWWRKALRRASRLSPTPETGLVERWQSIETAPKDGTLILLYERESDSVREGRYVNDACRWFEMNADPSDHWDGEIYRPTHWQPLPEPPALSNVLPDEVGGQPLEGQPT